MTSNRGPQPENGDTNSNTASSSVATEANPDFSNSRFAGDGGNFESEFDLKPTSHFHELFKGLQGTFIMLAGVILPSILILGSLWACYERITLLLLKHPIESLIEIALVVAIPVSNYLLWSSLVKCDYRSQIKRGILNGAALGTALVVSLISFTAAIMKYPVTSSNGTNHSAEVFIIGSIFLIAASVSASLLVLVRNSRISETGRFRALVVASVGVLLSIVGFGVAESRPIAVKLAEHMAISEDEAQKSQGMDTLRWLNPKKELKMECANPKAGGLVSMFIKLDNITLRQLYFQVTGEPFRDDKSANFSTMPDDYLQRHVVGAPVKGLTLHRSKMLGHISPETLSSTIYWNFVFKNKNYTQEEARVELGLPEGATISGMTVWKDGSAQGTMFKPTGTVQAASTWGQETHRSPGVVVDLGRGRVLLHCYPVPAQGQLRAAVAITIPAKLHTIEEATLPLPRIIDANFSMKGDHRIRMISPRKIALKIDKVQQSLQRNGQYVIAGRVKGKTISGAGVSVQVSREATCGPVAIKDTLAKQERYVVQTIKKLPTTAPKRLLVVLDGSSTVKAHLAELKNVLAKIPSQIDTSVILAGNVQNNSDNLLSLQEVQKQLSEDKFVGGQDNLEAVIKATELAGESTDGAVLWIHGPQPSFNKEIYILSPFTKKPNFYELALDNGIMNSNEFFKHHKDVGPFNPIARSGKPAEDLNRFLARWKPNGHEFVVEYKQLEKPFGRLLENPQQQREIGAMYARERCAYLLDRGILRPAVEEAVLHRIVTPVSLATTVLNSNEVTTSSLAEGMHNRSVEIAGAVMDQNIRPADRMVTRADQIAMNSESSTNGYRWRRNARRLSSHRVAHAPAASGAGVSNQMTNGYSPILQGAINGTIGPQGGDATAIMGVNTAGTIRLNNLANLEALLNIVASAIELGGLLYGGALLISLLGDPKEGAFLLFGYDKPSRFTMGVFSILVGLGTPGVVNYFIASARDANLFS